MRTKSPTYVFFNVLLLSRERIFMRLTTTHKLGNSHLQWHVNDCGETSHGGRPGSRHIPFPGSPAGLVDMNVGVYSTCHQCPVTAIYHLKTLYGRSTCVCEIKTPCIRRPSYRSSTQIER